MRFRKIWWGSWWGLGEVCEVPRCPLGRGLRRHWPRAMFLVCSSINVSIFHSTWLDTFRTDHIHTHTHIYTYICVYVYMYMYIYIYMYVCVCVYIYLSIYISMTWFHLYEVLNQAKLIYGVRHQNCAVLGRGSDWKGAQYGLWSAGDVLFLHPRCRAGHIDVFSLW